MAEHFAQFPDTLDELRQQALAYFRYFPTSKGLAAKGTLAKPLTLEYLLEQQCLRAEPLVYEDFLPVSAAGIFQSNLGDAAQSHYAGQSNRQAFETALGRTTIDELALYAATQQRSIDECMSALGA
jgi:uncharacterized glyoxalase superfamily metalloenzyme YdcJ